MGGRTRERARVKTMGKGKRNTREMAGDRSGERTRDRTMRKAWGKD